METRRKLLLAVLGLLLFVTVLSASAAATADRTVLDADFVAETAVDEGFHEAMAETFGEGIAGEAGSGGDAEGWPFDRSRAAILRDAVTAEHMRGELEANVDRLYAYLHGDRSGLRLAIDMGPIKRNAVEQVEAESDDLDLAATGLPNAEQIAAMADSEAAFDRERAAFREEQKARIQRETDRELSDEELEARLDESMPEIRERLYDRMDARLDGAFDGPRAPLAGPVRELQAARIDALTGAAGHAEYADRVDVATAELGDAYVAVFEARLDEGAPDEIDLTAGMDAEAESTLETARTVVSAVELLVFLLPLAALGLAGGIVRLAAPSLAALEVGAATGLAGGIGLVAGLLGPPRVEAALAGSGAGAGADVVVGIVAGAGVVLARQSALLLAVGAVLVAVGVAIRRDLLLDGRD